ncbi:hypothetical protein PF006_g32833 [Phytophthora fragariae]|uniref:Uncharacterized protein n=2 Tax=Phytophthora fragariae TaxID=53985 RepID=A0A6A3PMQ8_9STRA|nr:hypothetical protein PF003_g32917 [Phytophthora fragariae]KAE9055916.1 hypothetical protein PF006_g32833 [Phytophthora fragariae]
MPRTPSDVPSSAPSVTSIHVALPPLDRDAVRASISPSDAPSDTPSGAPSVSSIHMALPPSDRDAVSGAISDLTGMLDHVTALADLENDNEDLYFPRGGEKKGVLGCNPAPDDLILSLRAIDSAEPGCNPFRDQQAAHASAQIARLTNKSVPTGVL